MFTKEFFIGVLIAFLIGLLVGFIMNFKRATKIRADSRKRQKAVINGDITEKLAPFTMGYNPKDMYFIGEGIDYLIFDGLREGNLKQIVMLEIKTGRSQLNKVEREIKQIVSEGKIVYKEERFNLENLKKILK